jgi:hypothetical protein
MRYFHRTDKTSSKAPSITDIGDGEISINSSAALGGKLYIKLADNTIIRFCGMALGSGLNSKYGGTNNTFAGITDTTSTNGDSLVVLKYSSAGNHVIDRINNANLVWNNSNSYFSINRSGQVPAANLHVSGTVRFDNLSIDSSAFDNGDYILTRISGTSEIKNVPTSGFFNYFPANSLPTGILPTIPIGAGGTSSFTASGARTNLGLAIGTDVQAYSPILTTVASGTYAGNSGLYILGTVSSGIWNASGIGVNKGGTGADLTVNSGTTSGSLIYYDYISGSGHFLNKNNLLKWDSSKSGLGIGLPTTTAPSGALHVSGSIYYVGRPASFTGTTLTVDATGLIREATSSARFKENIVDYTHGLKETLNLRPVFFAYTGDGKQNAGFIAEEVDQLGLEEFVIRDTYNLPYSIPYGNMVALLVNAIKDLKHEVDELKSKIN